MCQERGVSTEAAVRGPFVLSGLIVPVHSEGPLWWKCLKNVSIKGKMA